LIRIDATEFFNDEFTLNSDSRRLLWKAIISMNTVAEYVALDRLGYGQVSRDALSKAAEQIREKSPVLNDLKCCAETFKHVRKIKDHRRLGSGFSTIATSAGVSEEPATWKIGQYDLVDVLSRAVAALSSLSELNK